MLSADRLLKAAEVAKMSPETELAAKECIVVSGGSGLLAGAGREKGRGGATKEGDPGE